MRSLPLVAVALTLVGLAACGRTSLFGWNDVDGGIPIEVDAGGGSGGSARRDAGAGGTGGRASGGTPGTGGVRVDGGGTGGATGGARDGGSFDAGLDGVGGRRTDGGGTGGATIDGGPTGGARDGGSDTVRPDASFPDGGRPDAGRPDAGGPDGSGTGGFSADSGSGGGPGTGGMGGPGDAGTGGSKGDAGLYECDPVGQDCAAGLRCDLPDNGQFVFRCLPDQGGRAGQNMPCQESSDCVKGASCLQDTDRFGNPIGQALCTVFCYANSDCPAGNHCLGTGIIGSDGELTFGLCLPNRR